MKRIITTLLIFALIAVMFSCTNGSDAPADTGKRPDVTQQNSGKTETPSTDGTLPGSNTSAQPAETAAGEQGTEPAPVIGSEGLDIKVYDTNCEVRDIGTFSGTELIIPSHVNGVPVTSIDEDALSNNTMVSLFIPWTVVSIGEDAVSESQNLEAVTFSEGLIGIGLGSFGGCPKLKTVTLPSSLERVGQSAFTNCTALTEVTLRGNADVNKSAFCECTALEKVTFTDKSGRAYSLKNSAFESDTALSEVKLSEGLETIGAFCFSGCSSLGSVYLPASLKTVEANAFANVGALKIFYAGSEEQWQSISAANGNDALKSAEIIFNYK